MGAVHPSHDQIGRQAASRVSIASKDHIFRALLTQFFGIHINVLCRSHFLGDVLDVAAVLGPGNGELAVRADFRTICISHMATQIHVQMLGRQPLSPLHEQAHGFAFNGETGTHPSRGQILHRLAAVANGHWHFVQ